MRVDWRRLLVVELALLGACALVVIVWWVVSRFSHTVLVLVMGIVVAFALGPPVTWLEERIGGRRALAAALVYLGLFAVVALGFSLLARPFVQQVTALAGDLPRYAEAVRGQISAIEARLLDLRLPIELGDLQGRLASVIADQGALVLGGTLAIVTGLTGLVVDLALVLVISFYLVLDSRRIRAAILRLVPVERREQALFVEETTIRIAGGYLRGQLILGVVIGVISGLGAAFFGLPYPLLIGVVAGVTELIPMIGPILGALPPLLLALLQPFPTVLWVLLFFVLLQQLENNLLVPRISGEAVGLHPLAAMLALMAGLELAGILGALFAVPLAGVLYVLAAAVYRRQQLR